ncbi:hypothetical protein Tco_1530701 [Tanacetum coccineum]
MKKRALYRLLDCGGRHQCKEGPMYKGYSENGRGIRGSVRGTSLGVDIGSTYTVSGSFHIMFMELLPPKKQIHFPSSSSTTLSNPSQNQTRNLVSPSSSVYTPTPPQIFEIGKCSDKMYLKHHEKQIEDILNYLDELSFHRIEKMEEGRINGNELKTELKRIRTQIIKLQKKKLGQKDKIAFAHYRISNLEQIIKEIQARHQTDQEDL